MDATHINYVKSLLSKAANAEEPHHALNFSQAACNAANALRVLGEIGPLEEKK